MYLTHNIGSASALPIIKVSYFIEKERKEVRRRRELERKKPEKEPEDALIRRKSHDRVALAHE